MVRGRAKPLERGPVSGDGIAHMLLEAVARMGGAQPHHEPVARHLGHDRSRRDRQHESVSADHRLAVAACVDAVAPIHVHKLRAHRQSRHRPRQCPQRGAQDVVAAAPPWRIDRDNILRASLWALARAVQGLPQAPKHVFVDGRDKIDVPCDCEPVIGGDYLDRLEKRDGRWRIVERTMGNDLVGDLSRHGRDSGTIRPTRANGAKPLAG